MMGPTSPTTQAIPTDTTTLTGQADPTTQTYQVCLMT